MLKVLCASPDATNLLITGCICINDQLVNVHKDIQLSIRCLKCQEYGHTCDACAGMVRCANCSSESHITSNCEVITLSHTLLGSPRQSLRSPQGLLGDQS